MHTISIHELMTPGVASIAPETRLLDAVALMNERRYSCLVVAERQRPVGILTERDLARVIGLLTEIPNILTCPVEQFMSAPPITIHRDETLFEALVTTRAQKVRHLPVVDQNGHLCGLVTQTDLANAHFHIVEVQREIIENSVKERTQELQEANDELKALSMEDPLMGIGNRRAMEVDLQHTHAIWQRHQQPFAIALLDVDYFKRYNDHYGHQAGDHVLQRVSDCIQANVRESDRVYRYGGEELLLLLPQTEIAGSHILVSRMTNAFHDMGIEHVKSPFQTVTASAGVCCSNELKEDAQWSDMLALADERLYLAKERGRNQVMAA